MSAPAHIPVLVERILTLVGPALADDEAVLLDATVGLGGHCEAVLQRFPGARVVGIDRDAHALELSGRRLEPYAERVTLVHAVYDRIGEVLADLGLSDVRAVLFDLGVSSMQLDEGERGFAYARDAPLDMRMDDTGGPTAAEVLNTYSAAGLARLLREYGEERFARRIAERIVSARSEEPFETSARLVDVVRDAIPAATRRTGGNPAKRTFQALRIEVNDELSVLRRALPAALDALSIGGRVVVMSYHSLEDRITKQALAEVTRLDVPVDLPVVPDELAPTFRMLTRGSEQAGPDEVAANPRSRSVRLRAAERVRARPPHPSHPRTRRPTGGPR